LKNNRSKRGVQKDSPFSNANHSKQLPKNCTSLYSSFSKIIYSIYRFEPSIPKNTVAMPNMILNMPDLNKSYINVGYFTI